MIHRIGVTTKSRVEFQDITSQVRDIVRSSGVESGICYVFVPHTTAAVTVNEHADPSVVEDIIAQLDVMVPQHSKYRHMEGNSPAHIKASLLGSMETLLLEGGELVLGTWQGVFFCEFDGPRSRKVFSKVVPDSG
ncbi:MAG: YjbQ family protein [Dehalococcoidia bacterium]|nr:MAG: YjbQ family protein [Dehalococcoidia bacterium]